MRRLPATTALILVVLAAVIPSARSDDMARLKPAICGSRSTCAVIKLTPAGHSQAGATMEVAEAHLGITDAPDPQTGCRGEGEANDGGQEYWLVEGNQPPRLVLKLCNDGYGAAGVGEDEVAIGNNRLSHFQAGGSNDRWEVNEVIRLSPQTTLRIENCSYRGTDPDSAVVTAADPITMEIRSLAIVSAAASGTADEGACDILRKDVARPPKAGFLAGIDVPLPSLGIEQDKTADFPEGTILGGCAGRLVTGSGRTEPVYGKPDPGRLAELRFLAIGSQTLVIQVTDSRPDTAAAGSWVGADHLEIWTSTQPSDSYIPDPGKVAQVGIGLDGKVYAGAGKPAIPKVLRWTGRDEQGRTVTALRLDWADAFALAGGVVIAYSQGEGGRQARLWATGPIRKNRPGYLPILFPLPVACGVVQGRWEVTRNPGQLGAPDSQN